MDKAYDPKQTEEKIYRLWSKSGYFNPDKLKARNSYAILLPPPNITGSLHMGHALNATIIDILIRCKRMQGLGAICLPGTDHAGIAAQNAVEKELKKNGVSRFDLGREKFVQAIWEWKEKYGHIILGQLQKIGLSADWSRTRFTMDQKYSEEVKKTFIHYYEKGLIYRGERVISWCPRCQTSLSDLEIEYQEEKSYLWYLKYPLVKIPNSKFQIPNSITVATTRPETMLGDAAVAVNPQDKRYQNLIGQKVILPISPYGGSPEGRKNREIPIIADRAIDSGFGTGAVKITPAHDFLDAEIAERHHLPFYQVINGKAQMTKEAGLDFEGLSVSAAREKIVEELSKQNLIEKTEDYRHNVARCYRCQAKIEPLPSQQWFLRMPALAKMAEKDVRSQKTEIFPKKFEKTYFDWLKNIKDWCISRQIWWGHQLPVWFHEPKCVPPQGREKDIVKCVEMKVSLTEPKCEYCDAKFKQSEEVLDTWFSSALWPFAELSKKDLKKFYPSAVLVTDRGIINLWVTRMIFSGLEFLNQEPFAKAFIHPTVLTKEGKRMSKSLGTGVDPLNLIEAFGADATRFGIIWQMMSNQDIRWDETAVLAGKKFCNKIWNASRFVLANKPAGDSADLARGLTRIKKLTPADKKIIKQLEATKKSVGEDIEKFRFGHALRTIYDFFWHQFCDVYIEKSKKQLSTSESKLKTQKILLSILTESLKMLHPFMPFVTEEIYQNFSSKKQKLLITAKWN
ncbi:MAG: valine--tRNA ligase [Patescibacteria group bacterium]